MWQTANSTANVLNKTATVNPFGLANIAPDLEERAVSRPTSTTSILVLMLLLFRTTAGDQETKVTDNSPFVPHRLNRHISA